MVGMFFRTYEDEGVCEEGEEFFFSVLGTIFRTYERCEEREANVRGFPRVCQVRFFVPVFFFAEGV